MVTTQPPDTGSAYPEERPREQVPEDQPQEQFEEERKESFLDFLKELPILIVVAFAIALLIKTFLFQAFFIPSGSMENTLLVNDRVLVCKINFVVNCKEPKQKDVVVFVAPQSARSPVTDRGPLGDFWNSLMEGLGLRTPENDFIKRVIATEGQTIEIREGTVFVDGKKMVEPYLHDQTPLPDFAPLEVPKGKIFVMGDNRFNSQDSRSFGPIPTSSIVGRAFVLIWPPDRFRGL